MITAIVLLKASREHINDVLEQLVDIPGVKEAYSVAGSWDIVAIIRVEEQEELSEVVTKHMLKVKGITDSNTLIAFKAYSKHDLERMWGIGE